MNPIGLILAGSVLIIALALTLAWLVTRMMQDSRAGVLAAVPLVTEQTIKIPPGRATILLEAPRMATDARSFKLDVVDTSTQRTHTLSLSSLSPRVKVSGVKTVKIVYGQVESGGELRVRASNLDPHKDYGGYGLIIKRPFGMRLALQIAGIVVCGVGVLLAIIGICWAAGLIR